MTVEARPHIVNLSPPVECYRCKRVRPPAGATNITQHAASTVASTWRPLCEDCMLVLHVMPKNPTLQPQPSNPASCRCLGAPIDVKWQDDTRRLVIGATCGQCGKSWLLPAHQLEPPA